MFEVDQEQVLAFKDQTLTEEGMRERCRRVSVPMDLRDDWPAALREADFDPQRPSVWLAEGLLPFLPADAGSALLERISELAAPGSTVVVENFGRAFDQLQHDPTPPRFGRAFGVEMSGLVDSSERRPHPADQLDSEGWSTETVQTADVAAQWGRPLPTMSTGTSLDNDFLVARR